jgi:FKBP-type peptidyl-prolyl cis-trans isomerase
MKKIAAAMIFSLGACLAGVASQSKTNAPINQPPAIQTPAGTNVLSDEKARISYAIGMTFAHNFQAQGIEVNPDILARGLKDMLSGGSMLLTKEEAGATLNEFQKKLATKQRQMREEIAATNKIAGEAFLAENKTKPGVVTLPDGLQYKIINNGTGATPIMNDNVTVNYRGTFIDGKEFDSSAKTGNPAQFPVSRVIRGWSEALMQMKVGSKWQVFVPGELAYGERGGPGIPGNSVLIFEVELLSIEHPKSPEPLTSDIINVPSQ